MAQFSYDKYLRLKIIKYCIIGNVFENCLS